MKSRRLKLALVAALLGVYGGLGIFPGLMRGFGVGVSVLWFRDTHSMLAASDAAREGRDPFVDNVYDVGGERHIYPDWWFALGQLGLSRSDAYWLGALIVGLFWLAALAVMPVPSWRAFGWLLVVCASPPFWLVVNRANPDLLVFALLTPVVPWLLHRERWVRLLAPGPVALGTGLKFFPLLAGAALLHPAASRRETWQRWTIIMALGLLLAWSLEDDVQRYLAAGWIGRGLFTFGAAAVALPGGGDPDSWVNVGRLAGAVLVAWGLARGSVGAADAALTPRERLYQFMGTAVLAGMFFLTVGYLYKIIFVVWLLPGLLVAAATPGVPGRPARFALGCLVALVWIEGLACALISCWPHLTDAAGQVLMRRTAGMISGLLAWGFIVPLTVGFGAQLRAYGKQSRESAAPRSAGATIAE
ncbi:MAG: hypothetical protein PSU94_04445 [Lacunisphaera sp.]|nr:hypothetical protein [Lacunisphaera sp.]